MLSRSCLSIKCQCDNSIQFYHILCNYPILFKCHIQEKWTWKGPQTDPVPCTVAYFACAVIASTLENLPQHLYFYDSMHSGGGACSLTSFLLLVSHCTDSPCFWCFSIRWTCPGNLLEYFLRTFNASMRFQSQERTHTDTHLSISFKITSLNLQILSL